MVPGKPASTRFFFDNGVLNALLANFVASADRIGVLFEHFLQVGCSDLCGLRSFAEASKARHRAVVAYLSSAPRIVDGVEVLPWQQLLAELDGAIS